jgi:hypothetical protein
MDFSAEISDFLWVEMDYSTKKERVREAESSVV